MNVPLKELLQAFDEDISTLSTLLLEDSSQDLLLTKEMKLARIKEELLQRHANFRKMCKEGLQAILSVLDDSQTLLDELRHSFSNLEHASLLDKLTVGHTWKELLAIPQQTLQTLYTGAKKLLVQGRYQEAECAFSLLALFDHTEYCFWLGLGVARLYAHKREPALQALDNALLLNPTQSLPLQLREIARQYDN